MLIMKYLQICRRGLLYINVYVIRNKEGNVFLLLFFVVVFFINVGYIMSNIWQWTIQIAK